MLFEKDGVKYEVTDPAHIDCFKSKGWKVVTEEKKPAKPKADK